jgi:hypothetical protein
LHRGSLDWAAIVLNREAILFAKSVPSSASADIPNCTGACFATFQCFVVGFMCMMRTRASEASFIRLAHLEITV